MMVGTTIVVGVTTAIIISMPLAIVAMGAMAIVGIRGDESGAASGDAGLAERQETKARFVWGPSQPLIRIRYSLAG